MINNKKYKKNCCFCFKPVSYSKGEKSPTCPHCGKLDYIKPPTEYRLFELQHQYFELRKSDNIDTQKIILGDMYVLLQNYAKGKIKKIIKNQVHYDDDKLDEKATEVAELLIEYYLTKPSFKIESSFGGYIGWQIKSVLYNPKDRFRDSIQSLNEIVTDNGKERIELQSFSPIIENSMNYNYIQRLHKSDDLIQGIQKIITHINCEIKDQYNSYMAMAVLIGIYISICKKSDNYKYSFYDKFGGIELRDLVDKSMMLILKFLRDHSQA